MHRSARSTAKHAVQGIPPSHLIRLSRQLSHALLARVARARDGDIPLRIRSSGNKTRFDIAGRYGLSQEMIVPWLENQSGSGLAWLISLIALCCIYELKRLPSTLRLSPLHHLPGQPVEWKGRRINEINEIGPERLEQTSSTAKAVGFPALDPAYSPHPSPTTRRQYQNTGCRRFTPLSHRPATPLRTIFMPFSETTFPKAFLSLCAVETA